MYTQGSPCKPPQGESCIYIYRSIYTRFPLGRLVTVHLHTRFLLGRLFTARPRGWCKGTKNIRMITHHFKKPRPEGTIRAASLDFLNMLLMPCCCCCCCHCTGCSIQQYVLTAVLGFLQLLLLACCSRYYRCYRTGCGLQQCPG